MNKTTQDSPSSLASLPDHPHTGTLLGAVAAQKGGVSLDDLRETMRAEADLDPDETANLAEQIRQAGGLTRDSDGQFHLNQDQNLVQGRLHVTRAGNGFVENDAGDTVAFVGFRNTGAALNGDIVLAQLRDRDQKGRSSGDRLPEARVLGVLKRHHRTMTGTLRSDHEGVFFEPADPTVQQRIQILDKERPKPGTRLHVSLQPWTDRSKPLQATVIKEIGLEDDARTDKDLVLTEYDLAGGFPDAALEEAKSMAVTPGNSSARRDLRDQHVITIDPQTAQDFDDALSMRRVNRDVWEVCVHIADVSHFVKPDSALDREAYVRGCSVYLPETVIPMLPERLSNDLCSLKPDVDRLAFTAMLRINDSGDLISVKFAETIIRSRRRLTYEEAAAAMDHVDGDKGKAGGLDRDTMELLEVLSRFSKMLRKHRLHSGALNMETDEVRLVLNDQGEVASLHPVTHDPAHQLIEEFMLLANEAACLTLEKAGLEQLHRNHPEPDLSRLTDIENQLDRAGVAEGQSEGEPELSDLLNRVSGRADQHAWTSVMLRALPKAEYSVEAGGHFGLAKPFYAHFTSPIRRYPDVVTHRLLKAMLCGEGQIIPKSTLHDIAVRCSERERTAQRAERHMTDMKLLRHLRRCTRRADDSVMKAVVMKSTRAGVQLHIPEYHTVGWLPSARAPKNLAVGEPIKVRPDSVNISRCDLEVKPAG